jgi:hypothetical protein
MRIRRFNEAVSAGWDNIESDVRLMFSEYTDLDDSALTIEDCHVEFDKSGKGRLTKNVSVGNAHSTNSAKLIKFRSKGEENGISVEGGDPCFTNLDKMQEIIEIIQRFYISRNDDNVNFNIENDWGTVKITFVVVGPEIQKEMQTSPMIEEWIKGIAKLIADYQRKRPFVRDNWISVSYSSGQDYSTATIIRLRKIANGTHPPVDEQSGAKTKAYVDGLIEIRDKAWEKGFKMDISGGDRQVVIKFVKR